MKNTIKLIATGLLLIASGCSDFLAIPRQGTYSDASFYKTAIQAQLALTGVYNATTFVLTSNNLWVFGDVASDDALKGGASGDQSDIQFIDDFTYARNNSALESIWKRYYEGITRANYLLYYSPNLEMDETEKNRILVKQNS